MRPKLFRPSSAPPLEVCTKFKSLERQTDEIEEGDNYHKDFASIFRGEKLPSDIPKSRRDKSLWAIGVQKQYCPFVTGVERQIEIYGEADQFITEGTIDLDGECYFEDIKIPALIDWKPGEYFDRSAQVTTYALGRMDEANAPFCGIATAFYNQGHVDWQVISYGDAQERVNTLVERLTGKRGPELHHISNWCSFCSVRMSPTGCPAWEAQRLALSETSGFPAELNASLSALKNDPEKRAKFIIARKCFNALCDAHELEEAALQDILDGKPGYGLKKQSRGFSLVIDKYYKPELPQSSEPNGETDIKAGQPLSQAEPDATS